ncbi:MAG TPA: flagellar protein FlgN [Chitinispirillaceae bacterium]|nr:flagellar protein FlgN [Chitinispirillaceae bacterium]
MEKLLEKLEAILVKESDHHQDLLKTAVTFNEAIKAEDLQLIQNCTAMHDEQVYKIAKLEDERIECSSEIAVLLGIKDEFPKLNIILQKIPQVWQKRLSSVQAKLKQQIIEISKLNTSSQILLQDALSFINSNIAIYQQSSPNSIRYGGKGKATCALSGRNLINKVV